MKRIKEWEVQKVNGIKMELGEGPVWDERRNKLYWVDILGDKLYEMNANEEIKEIISPNKYPSTIALDQEGNIIVTASDTIYRLEQVAYKNSVVCQVDYNTSIEMRFNDGKVSPKGDLWVGSMSLELEKKESKGAGNLYAINNKEFKTKVSNVTISNGLCWDEKQSKFYYIDTSSRNVYQYDYNLTTGEISNERICIKISSEDGMPDGMTIDVKGRLWIAHWEGSAVWCYNPETGEKEGVVHIPTKRVTCAVFGGVNMSTLYITTAKSEDGTGGELYKVDLDVKGIPSYRYIE